MGPVDDLSSGSVARARGVPQLSGKEGTPCRTKYYPR